jgi:hypothetical protein
MNPRRDSEGGVGRLPTPSSPANCIDPSKISTHKLTHSKLILTVTAEAAGSSPVVPAIFSNGLQRPSKNNLGPFRFNKRFPSAESLFRLIQ